MRTLALLLCLGATASDGLCRCAERNLGEYYEAAHEVFIGTLIETDEHAEGQRRFVFERAGEPYKGGGEGLATLPYVSSTSSAACGVEAEPGAVYVVFAEHDPGTGVAWLTTCNGTRVLRAGDGATMGFQDVPPRFVESQLAALAGLEALGRVAAAGPDPGDPANESLVGLLDVAAFSHAPEVPLFAGPDFDETVLGSAGSYEDIEHRESGYEVDAAVIYARVEGWSKVRRADGSFAWLAPDAAGTYWPLEELLPGRLAYLTLAWNRWIWPGAGAGNPTRLTYPVGERPREQMVNLLGATRIGGALWLEVEVLASNPCEGEPEAIRVRGWVPAYGESGDPVAWYYSRGC
jgi:hypothetical protein